MDPLFRDLQDSHHGGKPGSSATSSTETTPSDPQTAHSQDSIPDQRPDESTEAYLERLSDTMMDALNDRSFDHHPIMTVLAPNFAASMDRSYGTVEELMIRFRKLVETYPETHVRAVETKAYFYPNLGKADVYMNLEGTGNPPGLVMQGFCQLDWELIEGKWLCVRHMGMGGTRPQDPDQL